MRSLKTSIIGAFVLLFLVATVPNRVAVSQKTKPATGQANVASTDDEELVKCPIDVEAPPCDTPICIAPALEEAPTAFDDTTNGLVKQPQHDLDRETFEERDTIKDGLGPVYNAQACAECHQNPVSGSVSQINELRAGHQDVFGNFVDAPGGSLINDRTIDPKIQERVPPLFSAMIKEDEPVRTFRTSLNLLGDGFVEAVPNEFLLDIAAQQPHDAVSGFLVHGQAIPVPIEELPPDSRRICRIGRFGHKDQHASLLSFSGDAYLNEMGITNRLFLMENSSLGRSTAAFDPIPNDSTLPCDPTTDPPPGQNTFCGEDPERDIDAFTQFMRATKAPARDEDIARTDEAVKGDELFHAIGCAVCHVDTLVTAREGVVINGGTFKVPGALANKIIHPFGDFLLHDIGTGDGIVQNGGQKTRLKVRTAPLWGVRTHTRLMHDGLSLTFIEAIKRHDVEAKVVRDNFFNLDPDQQRYVITFLESL
ncbi:MAG TPA: di-heme oxidoredictase family protein [Pyrinomonadaceae bacterium]|nr:di-heme oxidoredictase family protein [Pyrinomonadaceae bacterium]